MKKQRWRGQLLLWMFILFRHAIVRLEELKSLGIIGIVARLSSSNYFRTTSRNKISRSLFYFYQTAHISPSRHARSFGCRCTTVVCFLVQNVLLHVTISPISHWCTYSLSLKIIQAHLTMIGFFFNVDIISPFSTLTTPCNCSVLHPGICFRKST